MPRRLLFVLDVVLVVAAGLLGVHVYRVWNAAPATPRPGAAATTASAPPRTATPAPPPARPPFSTFAVVADRNLFSPTRTETPAEPPKPATAGVSTPPAPKPRLYGIVLLPDGKARAYLEDIQRKKIFGYAVGDAVADSQVEEIKDDRVVLRRGSEVFEILLRDPSKPKPAPTPQVSGTPPVAPAGVPTTVPAAGSPGGPAPPSAPGGPAPAPPASPPTLRGRRPSTPVPRPGQTPPRPATPDPRTTPDEDEDGGS